MQRSILLIVMLFSLIQAACRHKCQDPTNPDCENYAPDPCKGKRAKADFSIRQNDGWWVDPQYDQAEDCDTIVTIGATFQAKLEKYQSFYWTIGTDLRHFDNIKKVELLFKNYLEDTLNNIDPINPHYYKPIPVTLTVLNNPSNCIAEKDTIVQKTRNLVFVKKDTSLWVGKYRGIFDIDGKVTDIEISDIIVNFNKPVSDTFRWEFWIYNFPFDDSLRLSGSVVGSISVLQSWKQWWWIGDLYKYRREVDGIAECHILMEPRSSGRDKITIKYTHVLKGTNEKKIITFKGERI